MTPRAASITVVTLGVAVRLGFLLWAGEMELWADEGRYVYQGAAWERFGFYIGSPRWLWPPGYPALLALTIGWFGPGAIFAAKLIQVLISAVVGWTIVRLAEELFAPRAGLLAGMIWALYLPLIAFTHYLWPETLFLALFLPALYLFLRAVRAEAGDPRLAPRLAGAGALLGATLYFKEAALPLFGLLPLVLLTTPGLGSVKTRLQGGALLVLAAVLVVLPWTLRNYEVYGRWVPSGSTIGENLYQGWNAHYVNYDYVGHDKQTILAAGPTYRLLAQGSGDIEPWDRSEAPNTIDRSSENSVLAKAFAREHPGFFLRSRLKKLADWFSPLSFFVRHQRNGLYEGSLNHDWARIPLVLLCVLSTALVLLVGAFGLWASVPGGPPRLVFLAAVLTFLSGVVVVSMSRYRLPVEPLLMVAAAGVLSRERPAPSTWARRAGWATAGLIGSLWIVNGPEILCVLRGVL